MANRWGKNGNRERLYFGGSKITADDYCTHEIKTCLLVWREAMRNLAAFLKAEILLCRKNIHYNQSYDFSSCHVWMWQLDRKEWWLMKNWWFWTVVLDKTLESPLDYKDIQQVNAKGNQSWIFIGRTNAEAEAPILWPTDVNKLLIRKDSINWEKLKVGGEEDDGRWEGWMASPTR